MRRDTRDFIDDLNRKAIKAWERIYRDYYSPLCYYALKILQNKELAEDFVQDIIIRLWEKPLHFENLAAFHVYIYRAVNNRCLNEIRDRQRADKKLKEWVFFTEDSTSESLLAVVVEETVRKLHALIDEMPPRQREVILLSMRSMKNEEISAALNISVNMVKKHKKKAYAMISSTLHSNGRLLIVFF